MTHHPHVHMIVPGGGLSEDRTKWIACRPDFLLPVRVLSRLFRRRVLAMLLEAYEEGRLRFFAEHAALAERQAFAAFLRPLKRSEWVVYAKSQGLSPGRRRALQNHDARNGRVHPPVPDACLPKGFHRIRHYGLLANGGRAGNVAKARALLAVPVKDSEPENTAASKPSVHARPCPCCGGRMIVIEVFARGQRQGDVLVLQWPDATQQFIELEQRKTKRTAYIPIVGCMADLLLAYPGVVRQS